MKLKVSFDAIFVFNIANGITTPLKDDSFFEEKNL